MKIHRYSYMASFLAICTGMMFCSACSSPAEDDYQARLEVLNRKIQKVDSSIGKCEGICLDESRIDLQVARQFSEYIGWDVSHPEILKEVLAMDGLYANRKPLTEEEKEKRYIDYIDRELNEATQLMDRSIKRIKAPVKAPGMAPIDWSRMEFKDGNFRVGEKVVFPGGFTILSWDLINKTEHPGWTAQDERAAKKFVPQMGRIGMSFMDQSIHVGTLYGQNGRLDKEKIRETLKNLDWYESMKLKTDIMFQFGGSEPMEKRWPGINEHVSNGVGIDIDHPGTAEMVKEVMAEVMPELARHPSVISIEMSNEPFFDLRGWTVHTMKDYRAWLNKRHGSIARLNHLWKTSYSSFNQIPYPKDKPRAKCSEGEWYDRIEFHNHRVASFYGLVSKEIHKYMPDVVVHLKAQDNNSLGPKPFSVSDGIDREALAGAVDLHGLDTRPLPVTEPRMAVQDAEDPVMNYDGSLYSFHWLGQSFLYDFLSSIEPHHPIVDMEYHCISINPIRVPDIGEGHARATLWLAHMHGLVGNMLWYWHERYGPDPFPEEYYKVWYYGSIATQPIVAAEYFQTLMMINRNAEIVSALAKPEKKPIRLLVSNSSYVQHPRHIAALHRAYEACCFHDLPVGFVTEKSLQKHGIPEGTEMIILPDMEYLSKEALSALRLAHGQGVDIVRFGQSKLTKDAWGQPHKRIMTAFLDKTPAVDYGSAPALDRKFGELIQKIPSRSNIRVVNQHGENAFGIMRRYTRINGKDYVLLVNVNPLNEIIRLTDASGKPIAGSDLLSHEKTDGEHIEMAVKGVRLIEFETPGPVRKNNLKPISR